MYLAMLVIGPTEWILIIVGILILFGASRIPKLMRGMGQGIREFKDAVEGDDTTDLPDSGGAEDSTDQDQD